MAFGLWQVVANPLAKEFVAGKLLATLVKGSSIFQSSCDRLGFPKGYLTETLTGALGQLRNVSTPNIYTALDKDRKLYNKNND